MLSEFIIFVIHHNNFRWNRRPFAVVNCFQNLLSLWYITTEETVILFSTKLWIAFRIYYLCDTSQLNSLHSCFAIRCELLSEFIIFVIHHNQNTSIKNAIVVVNCFQNLLSLWYITTDIAPRIINGWLWIAFRIYYLCDTSQQGVLNGLLLRCCELLSEFIIFVIHHNELKIHIFFIFVVNCFQNLLSLWYITT